MFTKSTIAVAVAVLAGFAPLLDAGSAEARGGGKQHYVQDYKFDRPMHGYSGRAGDYYCDYVRLPERKCSVTAGGRERCKVVSWTLRQTCY